MTILTHIFLVLGIVYFGFRLLEHLFDWALKKDDEAWLKTVEKHKRKTAEKSDESKSESHTLVGKTKTFSHSADSPVSQSLPTIPDKLKDEKATIKEDNFAEQNNEAEATDDESEEENEMQVNYTMDEEDEDSILREELLISDEPLPAVSASAILSRDLSRMNRWCQSDDTLDEDEQQKEVAKTIQSIQGTDLLAKYKQVLAEKAQDHKKLLSAIRKAEEQEEAEETKTDEQPAESSTANTAHQEVASDKVIKKLLHTMDSVYFRNSDSTVENFIKYQNELVDHFKKLIASKYCSIPFNKKGEVQVNLRFTLFLYFRLSEN